ncbi:hypothetical protein JT305_11300 [Salmonella enterica subsp. enterica serovar Senftenberg]|nr:hypothetical protein [Salmonella enterica subsp. enterica serovar Worthington]MBZ3655611.1 hypothetical protein [Salmonella enterica subsp. enterica serovar Senftenberg]UQQ17521.1 hypothetical protein MYA98_23230 [Salmonella sp. WGH-01]MBP1523505.1 hypothetical protein [Salmonella enterica subsp. enterica serovar Worthington]MBP1524562.1 hypothetical protein [Salmonella enterica subsp. enterica serovar Worthington]
MLAFAAKEQYNNLPEPSLRLSVMSQNLFFVLCAAHDDANAILRRKPLISVVPPFISIYTKSFELHQGGNSATPQALT